MSRDIQVLAAELQMALGVSPIVCGSITLNFNEATVQSVETKTHQRLSKALDRSLPTR